MAAVGQLQFLGRKRSLAMQPTGLTNNGRGPCTNARLSRGLCLVLNGGNDERQTCSEGQSFCRNRVRLPCFWPAHRPILSING